MSALLDSAARYCEEGLAYLMQHSPRHAVDAARHRDALLESMGAVYVSQGDAMPREAEVAPSREDAALREIVRVLVEDHPDLTFDDYAQVLGITATEFAALRQELGV